MIAISEGHNEARLAASLARINGGSLALYSTTRPVMGAAPGAAPLVVIQLDDPAGTIADNELTLTPSDEALVAVSGTAVWGRFFSATSVAEIDADVGVEITLPSAELYAGGYTRLSSGTFG
jgi:hypothetical protein